MENNLKTNTSNEEEITPILVGVAMQRFCSKCDKPKVRCKGMCVVCYQKTKRNTEKGKEQLKIYNSRSGKEARRKYSERKNGDKPPKPPKPPKQNCECGKPSVTKNLCMPCYQKYYARKKGGWKESKRRDASTIFNLVLVEVKKGFTIEKACKNANVWRSVLYRTISPMQKKLLNDYKILRDSED